MMKLCLFQNCRCRRCFRWWSCACFRTVGAGDAADDDEVVLVSELSVQEMLQMMMKLCLLQNCRCRRCYRWWWSCACFRTVGAGDAIDDEVVLVSELSVQEMLQMMMKLCLFQICRCRRCCRWWWSCACFRTVGAGDASDDDEVVLVSELSVQEMLQMMMKLCLFQNCRCRRCCRWWWSCACFRSVGAGDASDDDEVVLVSDLSVQEMLQMMMKLCLLQNCRCRRCYRWWWSCACFRTVGAGDAIDDDEVVLVSELSVQDMLQMMMKLCLFQNCRCRRCCRWWWSCACFRTVGAGDATDDDEVVLVSELSVQEMLQMMMKLWLFQICRCRRCCRWWWSCACFRTVGAGDAADDDEVVLVSDLSVQEMLQMMMKLCLFQNCLCRRCCRWWWSCACFRSVCAGDAIDDDEVVLVSELSVQEMLQMMMKLCLFQICRCRRCYRWWWSCACFRTVCAGDAADDDEVVLVSDLSVQEML